MSEPHGQSIQEPFGQPKGVEPKTSDPDQSRRRLDGLRVKDGHLAQALNGEAYLLFDGAMGTMLDSLGVVEGGSLPDLACLESPQAVTAVHAAYVEAGAEMATTNTFGSNRLKLGGQGRVAELYAAAVGCAREAGARYVGADIGPLGKLLAPWGDLPFEEAYGIFAEQACAADRAGADAIVIETMSDILEVKAAVLAARESCSLPVFASMTFNAGGKTFLGVSPGVAALTLESLGVQALGINCSLGPSEVLPLVEEMAALTALPLCVSPNAGLPRMEDGKAVYDMSPEDFGAALVPLMEAGAIIVGGCCGTNPGFIEAAAKAIQGRTPRPRPALAGPSAPISATSPQQAYFFEDRKAVLDAARPCVDETRHPGLEGQVKAGDYHAIVDVALDLQDDGARLLEVFLDFPGLDEEQALPALVTELQSLVKVPLCLTADAPDALEAAIRVYAGKPLVFLRTPDGRAREAMTAVAMKYGCPLIEC